MRVVVVCVCVRRTKRLCVRVFASSDELEFILVLAPLQVSGQAHAEMRVDIAHREHGCARVLPCSGVFFISHEHPAARSVVTLAADRLGRGFLLIGRQSACHALLALSLRQSLVRKATQATLLLSAMTQCAFVREALVREVIVRRNKVIDPVPVAVPATFALGCSLAGGGGCGGGAGDRCGGGTMLASALLLTRPLGVADADDDDDGEAVRLRHGADGGGGAVDGEGGKEWQASGVDPPGSRIPPSARRPRRNFPSVLARRSISPSLPGGNLLERAESTFIGSGGQNDPASLAWLSPVFSTCWRFLSSTRRFPAPPPRYRQFVPPVSLMRPIYPSVSSCGCFLPLAGYRPISPSRSRPVLRCAAPPHSFILGGFPAQLDPHSSLLADRVTNRRAAQLS